MTDVTRLNFFEVARAALSSRNISPRQEVRAPLQAQGLWIIQGEGKNVPKIDYVISICERPLNNNKIKYPCARVVVYLVEYEVDILSILHSRDLYRAGELLIDQN